MIRLLKNCLALCFRFALWLRYRFTWNGLDRISARQGVLFLPNHPGELDPVFLTSRLWPRFQPRAVAVEDFFYMPGVNLLMRWAGVIPMPNVGLGGSSFQRLRVAKAIQEACAALKRGENVLIYPSGRMMREGREILGGASAVHDILQAVPDAKIVLVRSRGFLGSTFSWVLRQQRPELGKALWNGIRWTLVNLFWFNPRRPVSVTFEEVPADFPRQADKQTLNRWLEDWYNQPGPEELSLVSHCRWWRAVPEPATPRTVSEQQQVEIPDDVRRKVTGMIAEIAKLPAAEVTDRLTLTGDLGFDSLMTADAIAWLQEEFQISDIDPTDLITVHDVMAAAVGSVREAVVEVPMTVPKAWDETGPRPPIVLPDPTQTIMKLFFACCDRGGQAIAMADDTTILTYKRLKLAVLALAEIVREQIAEERVGIMLPATAGANLTIMACLVAGKVPVMVNWTLGDANLAHVLKTSGIRRIISSGRFLDRLDQLNFELLKDYLVTLEDWRLQHVNWRVKLRAWRLGGKGPEALCRHYGLDRITPDDPGVVLYTSGSESTPKGVPLTHRQMLSDLAGAGAVVGLRPSDKVYGFLPPFHSFGYIVTGILPMIAGVKIVYYPNPTESRRLVLGIAAWQPTLICGTPTFVSGIFRAAGPEQLRSLRLIVCGAEKTPAELFAAGAKLGITIIEGYGITETAPVLTLNVPGEPAVGVGRPIGDVELRIVDPDTREPLPTGSRGLILARGTNIFDGYLGRDSSDAFHELDGKRYYITGDLGYLDDQGYLTLAGRLKRFVKIAGEMISLPAMEEALAKRWPDADGQVRTAISACEVEGERPVLCLFTVLELSVEDANSVLKEAGFTNLARVSMVIRLPEIPLLGTGKTDYQTLKKRLGAELQGTAGME